MTALFNLLPRGVKKAPLKLLPRGARVSCRNYKILSAEFGQFKTAQIWECVDKSGTPIPWYTYPAIEYVKQLDFSQKQVFEFGSGNSSIFWANRCKRLVSVEDNREWHEKIRSRLPANVEYLLMEDKQEYVQSIRRYADGFDVIIVDGSHRIECATEALKKLNNSGFIILDNSDWEGETSQILRESDLIEVDMSGFGPINGYTWTTSFYFTRNVDLRRACERQPVPGIGSIKDPRFCPSGAVPARSEG